jgi:hypothetical protein
MKIHYLPAIAILIGTASFSLGRDSSSHVDAIITSFASNLASPLKGYSNEDIGVKATEIRVDYGQGDLGLIVYGDNMGRIFGFKAEIRASIKEKSISVKFEEFPEINQLKFKELDNAILLLTEKINNVKTRENPSDTAPTSTIRKFGPSGEQTICKAKSYYFSNKEYYLNDVNKFLKLLRNGEK